MWKFVKKSQISQIPTPFINTRDVKNNKKDFWRKKVGKLGRL